MEEETPYGNLLFHLLNVFDDFKRKQIKDLVTSLLYQFIQFFITILNQCVKVIGVQDGIYLTILYPGSFLIERRCIP